MRDGVIEVARWVRMAMDTMEDWSRWMMKSGEMGPGEREGRIEMAGMVKRGGNGNG